MLVLASASPRRADLLRAASIAFTVDPADVPENPLAGEPPIVYAQRLAREKALAVVRRHPGETVLGADTVVVIDDYLLEKPSDAADAARMLRLLSGRTHQVITGVCLVAQAFERTEAELTQVTFSCLSDEEIAAYVCSGEPMDKAGAYGIQGMASRWVTGIVGDYFNVVGLPVARVYGLLREAETATGKPLI
jgi:septum formation protein